MQANIRQAPGSGLGMCLNLFEDVEKVLAVCVHAEVRDESLGVLLEEKGLEIAGSLDVGIVVNLRIGDDDRIYIEFK